MSSKVQRIMVQPIVSVISMCLTKTKSVIKCWRQSTESQDSSDPSTHRTVSTSKEQSQPADSHEVTSVFNLIFRYLQQRSTVQIWLYEQVETRIEGQIIGFDEFMNLVLEDAHEVNVKKGTRKSVGRILLKGDNITLIQSASAPSS
ncbi:hypothetical protein BG000_010140 [Podila horticola]|nr:hypothetical protein BG000_010140 [Podila horticola]